MTDYPTTMRRGGFAVSIPPMVVAGDLLAVVVQHTSQRGPALDAVTFRVCLERDEAPVWGLEDGRAEDLAPPAEAVEFEERSTRARAYRIPTSPGWRGVLLVAVVPPDSNGALVAPVLLLDRDENDALMAEVARLDDATPGGQRVSPLQGQETFRISSVVREACTSAREAAAIVGPAISVNARPHQESLAVLAGFEARQGRALVGNPRILRSDLVRIVGAVRRRIALPSPSRVAYQVLPRQGVLGGPSGPVLFLELSVRIVTSQPSMLVDGLVQQLAAATNPTAWDFRAAYEDNRLRVFARVGPFATPAVARGQADLGV